MMDFAFCTDKNYLKGYGGYVYYMICPPTAVETLRFHVLSDDLDDAGKRLLEGIAAMREGSSVCVYSP